MNTENKTNNPIDPDKPIKSPCISVCALDVDDVCLGCYRTMEEITQWALMENDQRREVLLKSQQRAKERGAVL